MAEVFVNTWQNDLFISANCSKHSTALEITSKWSRLPINLTMQAKSQQVN